MCSDLVSVLRWEGGNVEMCMRTAQRDLKVCGLLDSRPTHLAPQDPR